MFRSSQFDKSLEKATSQLLLEPDWDSILSICDCIRQEDIQGKYAVAAIKKKIASENPHVAMFSLQVLESCVKNCGETVHQEIATKEFMEFLKDQAKTRQDPVKGKVLELVQVWSHAFRNEPNYKIVQDTYNLMKLEGYSFPVLKEADAMFMAEKAPEWKEGDCCNRCRTKFGMVTRQHHCRSCGEVFCGKCSAKSSIIPRFGIEREVRVCDACFDQINKSAGPGSKKSEDDLPAEYLASPLSKQSQLPPQKSEQEIQEEEELQLAIALSQSEQESKEKERNRMKKNYGLYNTNTAKETRQPSPSPVPQPVSAPMVDATGDMDPELARYLNRNYWQQKSEDLKSQSPVTTPSAPVATTTEPKNTGQGRVMESYQNGESEGDQEQFLQALHSSLEIFVNRMKSNSQRGRSIANDSSVQSLMNVISNMHPQLMKYVQEQEDLRAHYETLQDKLAQLRDAREALDALREDHREKRRREQEELERQRQIQMAHKLEIMRQKKHELLEMQRQLALQRLQEQEREMQMRFEQQKQMTQMRQMQNFYPQMYGQMHGQMAQMPGLGTQQLTSMPGMPQNMPTQPLASHGPGQAFSPGSSLNSSPVHQLHQQGHGQFPQNMGQASMMQGLGSGGQGMPMQGNIAPGSVGPPGSSATVMSSQQMYQQNTGQTSYSQAGQYDTTHLASQPTSMQGQYNSGSMTGQSYQTNVQYNPVGSPPTTSMMGQSLGAGHSQQSLGAGQGPVGMAQGLAYSQSQMGPEYQPYNMQSVANAVPQYGGQGPPQQYMPGGNAHMGYQQDPNMQQGGQESGQQQRPPHPRQGEGELISFD